MKAWKALKAGDIVDVVAPASACKPAELQKGIEFLKSLGLNPRVPKDLFRNVPLFSNTDAYRFEHLKNAILAKDSKVIWCTRGGYGSLRLLPLLQKLKRPSQTKLFIGLSDVTSLHMFFNQNWDWPTVHGPMVSRLGSGRARSSEVNEVCRLIFGEISQIEFKNLLPMNEMALKTKIIRAPVVGGNLETIASSQGTPWALEGRGKILFIEEVNERGYRIDRKFQNLIQSEALRGIKAVLFGDFIGGAEPESGELAWKNVLKDFSQSLKVPVFKGLRSGHGELQRPLPLNTKSVLLTGRRGKLSCATGAEE
jgi:muramoyltetrapeptide carboxypeptidase